MKSSIKRRLFIILSVFANMLVVAVILAPNIEYNDGVSVEIMNLLSKEYRKEVTSSYTLENESKFPFSVIFKGENCDIFIWQIPIKEGVKMCDIIKSEEF